MNFDFAKAEEEYIDGDEIIGLGNLGAKEGTGRLRVVANQQKVRLTQKQQKKYKGRLQGGLGNVSGLASSLTFTPVQVSRQRSEGWRVGVCMVALLSSQRAVRAPTHACSVQPGDMGACAHGRAGDTNKRVHANPGVLTRKLCEHMRVWCCPASGLDRSCPCEAHHCKTCLDTPMPSLLMYDD